jgi:hypothetical protein
VRIHDNFIHHNQHPTSGGHALGYGVVLGWTGWAHIYRNVFDFNRHAIAADGNAGGYVAEENLVLKGGGYHGGRLSDWTHIFDVHGTGCWWEDDLCGNAGWNFRFDRNSFQYKRSHAIKIRGKPRVSTDILRNVFAQGSDAIHLNTNENVNIPPGSDPDHNILNTDTFGEYYSQCDFDGDGVDDLFLATGATWWFASAGKFHWSFLNTSSKRKKGPEVWLFRLR